MGRHHREMPKGFSRVAWPHFVWKFLEDEDKKTIAARLCAFGNAVINAHGLVVDGFREDEISWASTPTPSGIKIQLGASKLKGQDVSFDDYRGACR